MIYLDGDTFTLSDFERSATAKRLKIENKLEGDDILDYQFLIDKVILPIYKKYQQPIYVNSGFRSKLLNEKVGGVKNSQHLSLKNEAAADIDTRKGKAENKVLFDIIADMVRRR
ncbi:MAG TPA: D-Ala-D-Ala carboxypeptidase family metallohydrolase, partial [Bacteroidales bacterium]|nr:D-Ala-D-Ala carboxypeptidase family metallohydrolase [Bacteroidales bacterium]